MEITYKNSEFKIKGKTGTLYSRPNGVLIESSDGSSSKELVGPGEYEVSGISVIGLQNVEATVFIYEVDGLRICNLAGMNQKMTDAKLSQAGDIDILLLPVVEKSVEMMQQLESYYVIPFANPNQESLDKFLKDSGLVVTPMPKFSLKKEDIVEDQTTEIILLNS